MHSFAKPFTQPQVIEVQVTEKGFVPNAIKVDAGQLIVLNITRKTDLTCSTQIQIPALKIKKDLPLNQVVRIEIGKLKNGEVKFGCGMNMMEGGIINVE